MLCCLLFPPKDFLMIDYVVLYSKQRKLFSMLYPHGAWSFNASSSLLLLRSIYFHFPVFCCMPPSCIQCRKEIWLKRTGAKSSSRLPNDNTSHQVLYFSSALKHRAENKWKFRFFTVPFFTSASQMLKEIAAKSQLSICEM